MTRSWLVLAALALAAGMASLPVAAKEKAPAAAERKPIVDPRADRLLREMSDYLAATKQFSFQANIEFDDVLPSGQKIQWGAVEDVGVRRPDRAYVEYQGDLGDKRLWYDGKAITMYDGSANVYATTPVPNKLDGAIAKLRDDHGFVPPLSDFLASNPYKVMREAVMFGAYLGQSDVDGTRCYHLAFVDQEIDWQVWIEDGTQTVPRKLVVTYKNMPESPQFEAVLSDWSLDDRFSEMVFTPVIPDDATKLDFVKLEKKVMKK